MHAGRPSRAKGYRRPAHQKRGPAGRVLPAVLHAPRQRGRS
nr:MAG TPA: hypothetical protein [Caudoviricetes sp.]DAR45982.1 MAG TPA: hypothetical protein [Caudoviricetes sp.]